MEAQTYLKLLTMTCVLLKRGVLLVLIGLLLAWASSSLSNFMSGPRYLSREAVDQSKARFPAFTVCPIPHGYKEEVMKVCNVTNGNYTISCLLSFLNSNNEENRNLHDFCCYRYYIQKGKILLERTNCSLLQETTS